MTRCRNSGSPAVSVTSDVIARSPTGAFWPEYHRWVGSQRASVSANVMTPDLLRHSMTSWHPAVHPHVVHQISQTAGQTRDAAGWYWCSGGQSARKPTI